MITILLLQVCSIAAPIYVGDTAPCTGILWPAGKTREALACRKVLLPDCIREAKLSIAKCEADLDLTAGYLDAARDDTRRLEIEAAGRTPSWVWASAGVGAPLAALGACEVAGCSPATGLIAASVAGALSVLAAKLSDW